MPSDEHVKLSAKAIKWIANRSSMKGARGATEIYLAKGYLADAVAVCRLSDKFERQYNIPHNNLLPSQYETMETYYEAAMEFAIDHLCVFEVKVSRNDFQKTFVRGDQGHENRSRPIGNFHWCVTPKCLIKTPELPDFWGLLEMSGAGLKEIKPPKYCKTENNVLYQAGYELLWKRETNKYLSHPEALNDC